MGRFQRLGWLSDGRLMHMTSVLWVIAVICQTAAGQLANPNSNRGRTANREAPRLVEPNPAAVPPEGYRLTATEQERVDGILKYWEDHTANIKTFRCRFRRDEYKPAFSKDHPYVITIGTIQYAAPDKGLIRADKVYVLSPAGDPTEQPRYELKPAEFGEYWVCDGASTYEFDARTKTLTETRLPENMRGKAIAEGPLPFLFGANTAVIKQKYWVRELRPQPQTTLLFNIPAAAESGLDSGRVSAAVKQAFDEHQRPLSQDVQVSTLEARQKWQIVHRNERFVIARADNALNVYETTVPAGVYWLGAVPRDREIAANFTEIWVMLDLDDKKQLLPHAMKLFHRGATQDGVAPVTIYRFDERRANDSRDRVAEFLNAFVHPTKPVGWKKIIQEWDGTPVHEAPSLLPRLDLSRRPE